MHTLWVREHNRVARFIRANNPSITGEEVFLIARDIVTSEVQKITYEDFLPILLGDSLCTLLPEYQNYNDEVFPNIPNAFATAAYRYGHSQIQPMFDRLNANYRSIPAGPLKLVDAFFNTSHVREFGLDPLLRGLLQKNARTVDEFLNSILTNRLFADDADAPGLDLASLNIQRGRDHGIPTYLVWKQWAKRYCGVESEFRNELTHIRLLQTYGSLDNVDLFVGGLAEKPLPGGLVGAVFGCIFGKTFQAVRDGDRFFYNNADPDTALFTADQRAQIARSSLSRVICDNTNITSIQRNAFMAGQSRVPCSNITSMNLSVFIKKCFIRVGTNLSQDIIVSSRSTFTNESLNIRYVDDNSPDCFSFQCPLDVAVRLRVRPRRSIVRGCTHQTGGTLRPSQARNISDVYTISLFPHEVLESSGIYPSYSSCMNGAVTAVTFNCPPQSVMQAAVAPNLEEYSDFNLPDYISNQEALNSIRNGGSGRLFPGIPQGAQTSSDAELANLMSQLLEKLNARMTEIETNTAPPGAAKKAEEVEASSVDEEAKTAEATHPMMSNDAIISELEKLLQKV